MISINAKDRATTIHPQELQQRTFISSFLSTNRNYLSKEIFFNLTINWTCLYPLFLQLPDIVKTLIRRTISLTVSSKYFRFSGVVGLVAGHGYFARFPLSANHFSLSLPFAHQRQR